MSKSSSDQPGGGAQTREDALRRLEAQIDDLDRRLSVEERRLAEQAREREAEQQAQDSRRTTAPPNVRREDDAP